MIKRKTKQNDSRTGILLSLLIVFLILVGGTCCGLFYAYSFCSNIWHEQCQITNPELDVVISTGKMVHPDVITFHFGLTNGANLATIPFSQLREKLLKRVPNVRDIRIERRLPNRVTVEVIEREPIARIAPPRGHPTEGRVADSEGVVFWYNANATTELPIVRESGDTPAAPGKKLTGPTAAALRLVEAAMRPELSDLRVLEVDTSNQDYLYLTLGNYDHAKFAWQDMLSDTKTSRESLHRQLKNLFAAINAQLMPHSTVWLATDWGRPSRITASRPNNTGK